MKESKKWKKKNSLEGEGVKRAIETSCEKVA